MSASMRPTRRPWRASAAARFTETLDLPTPPLPEETASTLPRCGSSTGVGGGGGTGGAGGAPGSGPGPPCGCPPARARDLPAGTPGDRLHRLARVPRQGARVLGGQQEGERHLSPVVHGEVVDHAGGDDVLRNAGVLDSREGAFDAGAQRVGGGHARECTRAEAGGSTRAEAGSCPGQAVGCRLYAGYGSISQSNPLRWEYPGVKEVKER